MKNFLSILLLGTLILSACGGSEGATDGNTEDSDQAFYFKYSTAEFDMEVPDDWEVIDSFTSEYPDEIRAAFKNNIQNTIFTANVTVIREENKEGDTSYDYAQRKLGDHENTLLSYKLLSEEIVNLEVGGAKSKTTLSTFEGKNSTSGPKLIYMQVSLTKADKAWTVTATYREGEDDFTVEQLETMLRSFTLK